jgi:ribonuclease P protein component
VPPGGGASLRRRERLCRSSEFRRAFRQGLRLDGPLFLLLAVENQAGFGRLGLVASRRLGGAAVRNRAKRLLREGFRRNKPDGGLDVVLVPKPGIAERSYAEVERELRERLGRLAARRAAGRRRARPVAGD